MRTTIAILILVALLSHSGSATEISLEDSKANGRVGTEYHLSPDGNVVVRILLNQGRSHIDRWDTATGETLPNGISRFNATGVAWCVAFSPDSRTLALGSFSRSIELLQLETMETTHEIELTTYARALAFDREGKNLFYLDEEGGLWRCGIALDFRRDQIAKIEVNESINHAIRVSGKTVLITYSEKDRRAVARVIQLPSRIVDQPTN